MNDKKANEVLKITITKIEDSNVVVSIRVRTNANWLFWKDLVLVAGQSIAVLDNLEDSSTTADIIPRSDSMDKMIMEGMFDEA